MEEIEDSLDDYKRSCTPRFPVVGIDAPNTQLIAETRILVPAVPGHPTQVDSEYERRGVADLFRRVKPLVGRWHAEVTIHLTKADWARLLRGTKRARLVPDNLNNHVGAALYGTFSAAETQRLQAELEMHYTPSTAASSTLLSMTASIRSKLRHLYLQFWYNWIVFVVASCSSVSQITSYPANTCACPRVDIPACEDGVDVGILGTMVGGDLPFHLAFQSGPK